MKCDLCGKKATVHLTEIVDGQVAELHLCEDCAREKSIQMEQQFGLADLLAGLSDFGKQTKGYEKVPAECQNCGITYEEFKKTGRLGCSECYASFRENLSVLLKKIHGSNRHVGKSPGESLRPTPRKEKALDELRDLLDEAIRAENFEKAAELRDKIRSLEKRGESQ